MRRIFTPAILSALFLSVATIASNPRDPHVYEIAAAALLGAFSSGTKKPATP